MEANAKVAQSPFQMAISGTNVAAATFWMKARAGWGETHDLEVTGWDGAPLVPAPPPPLTVTFVRPGDKLPDIQPHGPPVRRRQPRWTSRSPRSARLQRSMFATDPTVGGW